MVRRALLTAVLIGLIASPALAIDSRLGTDAIGIFFEQTGDTECSTAASYTTLNAYVLAANLSRPAGISGWEGFILVNPETFTAGLTFDIGAEALNVFTAPDFQVGYAVKRTGNPITLCTITTFYLGGPILFGIAPGLPSSFYPAGGNPETDGQSPGYADGDDPGILIPLFQLSNHIPWTLPVYKGSNTDPRIPATGPARGFVLAGVNAPTLCPPGPVSTEPSTWGGVKNLYK